MRHLLILFALLSFAAPGCSCDDTPGANDDGMNEDSGPGGGGPLPEAGPGAQCVPTGNACTLGVTGAPCCTGVCNDGFCEDQGLCTGPGGACTASSQCCTNNCANGTCTDVQCSGVGQACSDASNCCSRMCGANGTCEPVPAGPGGDTCTTLGEACGAGSECCSTNCQGGVCVRAASCQANGDVCSDHTECCGNNCSAEAGGVGRCQFITGGGGGGCLQGGNPCPNGGTNCCSRICVDVGSGVPVCQFAGGCRLTGEWCVNDDHCCGGGANPNGSVVCQGAPLGRCDNGQSCNPVGNICGAPVLPSGGGINASQNCCDGQKEVCKLDSAGIPRCFGGCPNDVCPQECPTGYDATDPNCCIAAGNECQFRDQCCNFAPCVPNANGVLVCGAQENCVVIGDICTPGAPPGADGCCEGTTCAESSTPGVFVCNPPGPIDPGGPRTDGGPVDPSADAGPVDPNADAGPPPDTGTCAPNGTQCTMANECCSSICSNGMCGQPQQCQPLNAACTGNADCCAGLGCAIPVGQSSGTCQASECGGTGSPCSAQSPCCSGLNCRNIGTQMNCDGTTACVCQIDL